jgi:hypothetical protein
MTIIKVWTITTDENLLIGVYLDKEVALKGMKPYYELEEWQPMLTEEVVNNFQQVVEERY